MISEGVLSTALIGLLASQWTKAVQYAIRPYWTFEKYASPDTNAFNPLRDHAGTVWKVAVLVSAVRWALTVAYPQPRPQRLRASLRPVRVWWPIPMLFQTVLVTVFAGGVLASVGQGEVFAAVVAAGLFVRKLVLPRIPGVSKAVNAVPVLIRLAAIVGVGYLIGRWRVGAAYHSNSQSLVSFAETIAVTVGCGVRAPGSPHRRTVAAARDLP